jgi:hypothetical protein
MSAIKQKIHAGITTLAWVASEYFKINPSWIDADDYIQTMIVFESLVEKHGFDHADLVMRYRAERPTKIAGITIKNNGVDHVGQMHKLKQDPNPLYIDDIGFTPGCAMKAMPLGVWHKKFDDTVLLADNITRITHGTAEARLVGVLTALRYRHALLEIDNPDILIQDWTTAAKTLNLYGTTAWDCVNRSVQRAKDIIATSCGVEALCKLLRRVGLMYFAWSGPISAIFWSYVVDVTFKKIFMHVGSDKKFTINSEQILVDNDVHNEYASHVKKHHVKWKRWLNEPKTGRQDSDTFFSIAFSIASIRNHNFLSDIEQNQALDDIGREDWTPIIDAVDKQWK